MKNCFFLPQQRWKIGPRKVFRGKRVPPWMVLFFVLAALFLVACGGNNECEHTNCVAAAAHDSGWNDTPTGPIDQAVGELNAAARTAKQSTGWGWIYFWVFIIPAVAMLVPGTGRREKFGEAVLFGVVSTYLLWIIITYDRAYLWGLAVMNILLAVVLFIWGIVSPGQSDKFRIFVGIPLGINLLIWLLTLIGVGHALIGLVAIFSCVLNIALLVKLARK